MRAAMAVVERFKPVINGDPLTASGPVLMSQTVQGYYGISTEQFCDTLHVKDGLVLKAYPKGQWFTPCWPWANLLCYKKLETVKKFLVKTDVNLQNVVGVHHYSGTWFGQSRDSKNTLRERNRMLAAAATVKFFWDSPHFVEYKCGAATAFNSSTDDVHIGTESSAGMAAGNARPKLVHRRPGVAHAADTQAVSAVVRRLRRLMDSSKPTAAAAAAAAVAAEPAAAPEVTQGVPSISTPPKAAAAAAAEGDVAVAAAAAPGDTAAATAAAATADVTQASGGTTSATAAAAAAATTAAAAAPTTTSAAHAASIDSTSAVSSVRGCPAMLQLASLQPCLVLSFVHPTTSSQQSDTLAAGPSVTADASINSSSSSSASSSYWANVDGMLSMWQQSLGCHVTVAGTAALLPAELVQLSSSRTAATAAGAEGKSGEEAKQWQLTRWFKNSYPAAPQQQHGQAVQTPAAVFVNPISSTPTSAAAAAAAAKSAGANQQQQNSAQQLAHLLRQQWQQQLQAMGCNAAASSSRSWRSPPLFTCKSPQRHAALHLSGSADQLLELAQQIYKYNANVSHAEFEQHGRYSGAVHPAYPDPAAAASNSSNAGSSDSGLADAQSVVRILDTVDILLLDVERPIGTAAHIQGWSTLYNLLYQLHGFVGFAREPLPDGRTRLGWIRRPDRLARSVCGRR
jgi:hypothetical protein